MNLNTFFAIAILGVLIYHDFQQSNIPVWYSMIASGVVCAAIILLARLFGVSP